MNCIAERVEDSPDLIGNVIWQGHHIEGWQAEIVGKSALNVDTDTARAGVQMKLTCSALATVRCHHMAFTRAALSDLKARDVAPDINDLSSKFMPDNEAERHRVGGPVVPVPNMDVSSTDSGFVDPDEHIVRADIWYRRFNRPQPFARFALGKRKHHV